MFTNQKIEAAHWPWSTLQVIESPGKAEWAEKSSNIPTVLPQNGIGSNHDVRSTFEDSYVDLSQEVEHLSRLSQAADRNVYLA